jgi:hypothetical protein
MNKFGISTLIDLDLLSQMTGKSFSGPLPPIALPTTSITAEPQGSSSGTDAYAQAVADPSQPNDSQEEVVGFIDEATWNG